MKARVITTHEHFVQVWLETYKRWVDYPIFVGFPLKMSIMEVKSKAKKIDDCLDFDDKFADSTIIKW